jgi:hypothetical protein
VDGRAGLGRDFFPEERFSVESQKLRCLGSAVVSTAAFGVPLNALEITKPPPFYHCDFSFNPGYWGA